MQYVESQIDKEILKDWVNNWNEEKYIVFLKNRFLNVQFDDSFKKQVQLAKLMIVEEKNHIRTVNRWIMDYFYKFDNSSMLIANLFETVLVPSDLYTQKALIKGFDDNIEEKGNIKLMINNKISGNIGEVSDLYFLIFHDNFVQEVKYENDEGTCYAPIHANNIDKYLSIQIWDPEIKDHDDFIQKVLYYCSKILNLNFKRVLFDKLQITKGEAIHHLINIPENNLEKIPLLYYNSSNYTTVPRLIFLSYYQTLEYFYIRANNILLQKNLIDANISDLVLVNFEQVHKALKSYINYDKEKESLKLIIEKSININGFLTMFDKERIDYYTTDNLSYPNLIKIDISTEKRFISTISERIYSVRCSIVHSKGDTAQISFIPDINETIIACEIPLIKNISSKVLEHWSK